MATNKFLGILLDPGIQGPVDQDVAEIDQRGRLQIPSRLISSITWLKKRETSSDALVILDEPGRIRLLSWENESTPILTRRKQLIENSGESSEAVEALRLLEDRYKHLIIPKDSRPTLSKEITMHLGIPDDAKAQIYIVRVFEALEILSPQYRNGYRKTISEYLSNLP